VRIVGNHKLGASFTTSSRHKNKNAVQLLTERH
jgi:hypothetical protein